MTWTSYGDGLYRVGEAHTARFPRSWKPGGELAIIGIGFQGLSTIILDPTIDDGSIELARRGLMSIAGDFGAVNSNRWGNVDSDTSMDAIKAYAASQYGADVSQVYLVGGSMGATTVLNWARTHLAAVRKIALTIPALDVEDIRANNRMGAQASIETAYVNNAGWQATRPTRNPIEFADELSAVPIILYYSADDPTCLPQFVPVFAEAHGNVSLKNLGNVGHDGATVNQKEMVSFLLS